MKIETPAKRRHKVRDYFKEYCESTSIHGFRYFGERRSNFEKLWWAIVFVSCLSFCITMIYKIYQKYDQSPVIVTFATKETSINSIPFPAVTICPVVKSDGQDFNYTKALLKARETELTGKEGKYFDYLSSFCDPVDDEDINYLNESFYNHDFFESLDNIKPVQVLYSFEFRGKKYDNIMKQMTRIFTDEGICYSFNILDRSEIFTDIVVHYKNFHRAQNKNTWSIDKGYLNDSVNIYPHRSLLPGATNGLNIVLATFHDDIDYNCQDIQGYKVLLHSPGRIPRLKEEFFRVPLDHSFSIIVHPSMITTSDAVKSYSISKRDCLFPSEKKLRFFRTYSQLNCQLECLTNFTMKECGCVKFYMPRDNNTKICSMKKIECLQNAEVHNVDNNCNCMPLCADLSYRAETSQIAWNWRERYKDQEHISLYHQSQLLVYFKVDHFITNERNELYGPLDFLSNFGGLLGLFTGFSILSFMEIIYFLTVRICCNRRLYGDWSGRRPEES